MAVRVSSKESMTEELKVSKEVEEVVEVAEVVTEVTDQLLAAEEEVAEEAMAKSVKEAVVVEVEEVEVIEVVVEEVIEVVKMVMANLIDTKVKLVKMLIQWIDKMVLEEEEEAQLKEVMEKPTGALIKMLPKMVLNKLNKTKTPPKIRLKMSLKKRRRTFNKLLRTKSQKLLL